MMPNVIVLETLPYKFASQYPLLWCHVWEMPHEWMGPGKLNLNKYLY